jgi:BASS family bile acid:Na+ symporter
VFIFLSRNAAWVLALGVFAGLALPGVAAQLRPLLPLAVAGLLVLSVMQTSYAEFRRQLERPRVPASIILCLLCASPAIMWVLVNLLEVPDGLKPPLVLMAAAPPIMAAPAMALMLRLHTSRMLAVVVGATLLAPFTLGLTADWFVAAELRINPFNLALRLAAFISICFALAAILRLLLGSGRINKSKPYIDVLALLLLLAFAVAIMDGVTHRLSLETEYVLTVVAISFLANVLLQAAGGAAFFSTGASSALTAAFACGNRNMGLLLAVMPESSAPDTLLYFAVAQIPMYTLPALLSPMYNALLKNAS